MKRNIQLLACLFTVALSVAAVAAQTASYRGRAIADVMSYRGAPWLERADREREENPQALLDALPIEAGDTVADLGCGSGYYGRRLAATVGAEGLVYCVDIQPEMLRLAERLAEESAVTNLRTILNHERDAKLPAASIDLILLVDVYHELRYPESMLESMRRSLKPDGIVALAEFRLEGETASHIKLDHRMSVDQVLAEWQPAGFRLIERIDTLPTQHLFLFAKSGVEN